MKGIFGAELWRKPPCAAGLFLLPLTLIEARVGNRVAAHPCSIAWSTLAMLLGKDLELEKVHHPPWQLGLLTLP